MSKEINQKNYQYLTETLANLGFGVFFNDQLKSKMQLGLPEIKLLGDNTKPNGEFVRYAPNLSKSKNEEYGDYYFLNSITAVAHDGNRNITSAAEFKIFKKSGFSIREMENLLAGRPVYREFKNDAGTQEGKWYRLDLSSPDDNGKAQIISYPDYVTKLNVERELDKLNIIWADKNDKANSIQDLKAGERVGATAKEKGATQKIHIEVAPQLGGLAILNNEGKVLKYTNSQAHFMQKVDEARQGNTVAQANMVAADDHKIGGEVTQATIQVMDAVNKEKKESKGNKQKVS